MVRIVIADDHVLIREGFKKLIDREPGMTVVAEAGDAKSVFDIVRKIDFDILVLDLNMPNRSGLDILIALRERDPKIRVLILSMYPEEQYAMRAFKAGARGYLSKESAPDELLVALRRIYNEGKYVSPTLAEYLISGSEQNKEEALQSALSNREFQVFQLIASGKTIHEIAGNLSLSISTVNTYRKRVLDKMQMSTNLEIIRYVIEKDLTD
jgi:two-component system, NarL family, invasion response regulator UvrY